MKGNSKLKSQMNITSRVIKNFNETIRKLQIDENTFNDDTNKINLAVFESKLTFNGELFVYLKQSQRYFKFYNICTFKNYSFIDRFTRSSTCCVRITCKIFICSVSGYHRVRSFPNTF